LKDWGERLVRSLQKTWLRDLQETHERFGRDLVEGPIRDSQETC